MEGRAMTEWHPDLETLERFLDDELPEEPSRTLQRHLFTCPRCEARLIEILPAPPGAQGWATDSQELGYRDLVRQVLLEARREGKERRALLIRERNEAGQLWREIRDLGAEARLEL